MLSLDRTTLNEPNTRPGGLEPPTYWFEASHSVRLSYGRIMPPTVPQRKPQGIIEVPPAPATSLSGKVPKTPRPRPFAGTVDMGLEETGKAGGRDEAGGHGEPVKTIWKGAEVG